MRTLLLFLTFLAHPILASHIPYSLSPVSGPKTGGTTVILRGAFDDDAHRVLFGGVPAPSVSRLDEHTLAVVTPAHFGDDVSVEVYNRTHAVPVNLTYSYRGETPLAEFERLLLPIYVGQVRGNFGSDFRTVLHAASRNGELMWLFGLKGACPPVLCSSDDVPEDTPVLFYPANPPLLIPNGTPGRFIYVPKDLVRAFTANLRVADVSRSDRNFGTEVPIVREREFVEDLFVLHGVPMIEGFRNTLRIYAPEEVTIAIEVEGTAVSREIELRKNDPANIFEPAYGEFTDFAVDGTYRRIQVRAPSARGPSPPIYYSEIWGFVSVTNNETQMITVISPQP